MLRRVPNPLGVFVVLAALTAALVACGEPASSPSTSKHVIGDGPLAALAPGPRTYQTTRSPTIVTFGAVTLCSTDPQVSITLHKVRYEAQPAVKAARPWLRFVPNAGARVAGDRFDWRPLIVAPGYPGKLRRGPWRGSFTKNIEGVSVDPLCFGASNLDAPRIELLTALKVGPKGTSITRTLVDYHVGVQPFTLVIAGHQRVCGTAVRAGC